MSKSLLADICMGFLEEFINPFYRIDKTSFKSSKVYESDLSILVGELALFSYRGKVQDVKIPQEASKKYSSRYSNLRREELESYLLAIDFQIPRGQFSLPVLETIVNYTGKRTFEPDKNIW